MEKFKSKFNGCTFVKEDNGRCYQMDNAIRGNRDLHKMVKRRIAEKDYNYQKSIHEQMLIE